MATTIHIDKGLILQVKQRDETAFLELYDRTSTDVARLVSYLLDDPSELEDVIQEIYVAIYRALSKFDMEPPIHPSGTACLIRVMFAACIPKPIFYPRYRTGT